MWSRFRKLAALRRPAVSACNAPLLNAAEIAQLHEAATSRQAAALQAAQEVLHPLLGERSSVYAGSGFEFADNRTYSAGDDMRFINWRLLARSGQLYRKLFVEERRPEVWLVMDRRASMRFGTRVRPKVAQAARVAIYYLHRALHQQLACGAILLEDTAQWLAPARNVAAAQALQDKLIAPCPPTGNTATTVTLPAVLRQLQAQLTPGCIIVLISDFHDLAADATATLYALSQSHTVLACHIADPLELAPPAQGQYTIQNDDQHLPQTLHADDPAWQQQWQALLTQHQHAIAATLKQAGVRYQKLLTTTDMTLTRDAADGRHTAQ